MHEINASTYFISVANHLIFVMDFISALYQKWFLIVLDSANNKNSGKVQWL